MTQEMTPVPAMPTDDDGRLEHPVATPQASASPRRRSHSIAARLGALSPKRASALYVLGLAVLVFSLLSPDRFFSQQTALLILNGYAISGIVAVTLVIPLAAGLFDVSVGYVVALAGTLVAYLVASSGLSPGQAVVVTLIAGVAAGLVNAFVVVGLRVTSLIGTLATGAVFLSVTIAISNQQSITQNVNQITELFSFSVGSISMPVLVLGGLTILIWFVMRYTTVGRYWYAVGYDSETARLAGLPVSLLQTAALVTSGLFAALAGALLTARIGAGSPTTGPDYLLPAFAAAFVGATQFSPGRFNPFGTLVAVYLLATATVGLNILGAPIWAPQLMSGLILIIAVATNSASGGSVGRWRRILRRGGRGGRSAPVESST